MKQWIVLSIAALLFLNGCANTAQNKGITVNINASGEIIVQPDMATFNVTAGCVNQNIEQAKSCVKNQLVKLIDILKTAEVAPEDIQSQRVELRKEHRWQNNTQVFKGYRASISTMVTLRDLNQLNRTFDQLLVQKDLNVSGLSYSHSKVEDLTNDAYLKALENAKLLVDKLRRNVGGKSVKLLTISNNNDRMAPLTPAVFESRAMAAAPKELDLSIGTIKIIKNLNVQYLIQN